ncbi:MAG TPA: ferrous iron transport protein B [Bacteroidales bacterium]|nr:ferrous iron transport protein B [Bacteroidales bacterium]
MTSLIDLRQGERATIIKVKGRGAFRKRITEMGFVSGREVTVVKSAPLQDPIQYKIIGYHISLRQSEARLIEVERNDGDHVVDRSSIPSYDYRGTIREDTPRAQESERGKVIEVALVGNPNCGKTTLFNVASGSHERVGNFSGVTVDAKEAVFRQAGYTFNLTDLPGTYSLTAYSPEEIFVRQHITGNVPDIVVNVVDASNLERNLYLTTQLIDMDIRVIIALNMYDEFTRQGNVLDHEALGRLLGIPVIPTVSSKGTGIPELFNRIIEVFEDRDPVVRHVHINYGSELERSIRAIQEEIRKDRSLTDRMSSRFTSIKLLEKDTAVFEEVGTSRFAAPIRDVADREIRRLEAIFREDSATLTTDAKYGFVAGALRETMKAAKPEPANRSVSERIDSILTHKLLGFPVFILFLWIMFQSTFLFGEYPKQWISLGVGWVGSLIENAMPAGPLKDLLVDGIINGVGSVIVFLPNILILFLFISVMEDSGYMARAAFIMDKLMHKMGLHGQSFIPLIMGFGCNVPAIMVTRTLKDRNDRLLTMLINPFMSCSARLPVYILVAGAVFPGYAGSVIFGLYLLGILLAILISLIFKKLLFKSQEAPFVMELPPYRMPTLNVILRHMWDKGKQYLHKMGGVILIAVILIWALEYFPGGSRLSRDERLQQSFIAHIGHTIEPVIAPLGFDWRMGVSLMTGAAAKEVVVSTMGVLFGSDHYHGETGKRPLGSSLREATYTSGPRLGEKLFTPLVGASYLIFILIYMPCVAVVATVNRESGSWKWALFLIGYTTLLAWLLSFAVYQIGSIIIT